MTGIEAIAKLFAGPGSRDYLGEAAALCARRGSGAPLGRRGQGPRGHPAGLRPLRAATPGAGPVLTDRACGR